MTLLTWVVIKMKLLKTKSFFLIGTGVLCFVLVAFMGYYVTNAKSLKKEQQEFDALVVKTKTKLSEVEAYRAKQNKVRNESAKAVVGFDMETVSSDTSVAFSYFKPAFTWSSSAAYDKTRAMYVKSLGKNSPFVKTYMPEQLRIQTADGSLSYIEFNELKSSFDTIVLVPTRTAGSTIDYIGFATYYPYKKASDLKNTKVLKASQAIVSFRIKDGERGRVVTNVSALPGFGKNITLY